ncbi:MAG: deoxynucleoside kinase [Longimicrobiales bacterium]
MLLAVSGMVGTGKTTLARALARYFGFAAALENTGDDNPWLGLFYGDSDGTRRYALPLQLHFLARRMESMRRIRAEGGDWIIDRTWYEDAEVFARGLYERALLSPLEYDLYQRLYAELTHAPAARPPRLMIYLHGPLEDVVGRIATRARSEERSVPYGYWAGLHDRYRRWIQGFHFCKVLALDFRHFDLVGDPAAITRVAELVAAALGTELERTGVQFRLRV